MANYANLLATIAANIYTNNNNEVTAAMVEAALQAMVTSLGAGYQFMDVATPATNPGTPDQNVFYLAIEAGTYTYFGGTILDGASVAIFKYSGSWSVSYLPTSMMRGPLASCDLNDIQDTGTYMLYSSQTYQNSPENQNTGFLRVSRVTAAFIMQEFYSFSTGTLWKRRFESDLSVVNPWEVVNMSAILKESLHTSGVLPSGSLADVQENGIWLLGGNSYTYTDVPISGTRVGFLRVSLANATWGMQEFFSFSGDSYFKRRFEVGGTAEAWQQINKPVNNTYNFNTYAQTLSVSATPTITTDDNQFLAATGDASDRTADILTLLGQTGVCRLGPGDFYVKNLIMPDNTSIIGSGSRTRVILDTSVADGFAIKIGAKCMVKDFWLKGYTGDIVPNPTIGTRHGLLWQGDYTQSQTAPEASIVTDLIITDFHGGGITCYDTGYGTFNFINVSNVNINGCDAGLNISYWSEYHKFTNVRTCFCHFGCVNNGGNNVFVNCDFSGCRGTAFIMDNSQGQSPNNTHGSCVACVFNHTASDTGKGIEILNCKNGFIFSGCQIFFSKIVLDDADGVVFQGCNFGENNCDISVDGGGTVLFANNMHQDTPPSITITNNTNVHFVNCYNRATGAPISA